MSHQPAPDRGYCPARPIVATGRARGKIENENNPVLEKHGYHRAHNFGQGHDYWAQLRLTLNRLAFLFDTVLDVCDTTQQRIRRLLATRQTFFNDFQALCCYFCFASWQARPNFMAARLQAPEPPD